MEGKHYIKQKIIPMSNEECEAIIPKVQREFAPREQINKMFKRDHINS